MWRTWSSSLNTFVYSKEESFTYAEAQCEDEESKMKWTNAFKKWTEKDGMKICIVIFPVTPKNL